MAALLSVMAASVAPTGAQTLAEIPGVVTDVETRMGIEGVVLRVSGTTVTAVTDSSGSFVLRGLSAGRWTLLVQHLAYGNLEHEIELTDDMSVRLEIRLAESAIELEPITVEAPTRRQQEQRARGSSQHVVERQEIERAMGVSRHLGDLIRQTVPGIRVRQSNNLAGTDVCLEFRSAADASMLETRSCNHPMVYLDGVPISDPNFAYGTIGLSTIERIEVLPPGEAGARYGSGSLYGVLLIETRPPGGVRAPGDRPDPRFAVPVRKTFDWTQETESPRTARTVLGAFLGNAVGLAVGLSVGGRCISVDDRDQIVSECGGMGNAGAVAGAVVLPSLGSALGARWGGGTEMSVGRLVPAMLGAGMVLFPGYAYSMSTVGRGSEAANTIGAALLLVGTPVAVTLADRLFRKLR